MLSKKPLRILQVLPTFCKGGGERLVYDLANYLSNSGHNANILAVFKNVEQGGLLEETLSPNIKLSYITKKILNESLGNSFLSIVKKLKFYFHITSWIFRNKTALYDNDIIHVHLTYGSYIGTLLFLLRPSTSTCKIVETSHTDSSTIKGIFKLFFEMNWRFRNGLIFELKKADHLNYQDRYPHIASVFIPIGSSAPEGFSPQTSSAPESIGKIVIGQVGRLNIKDRRSDKYIYLINELYQILGANFIFYMYGDGPDRLIIEQLITDYGLEDVVEIKGYTDDLALAFKSMDIYVTVNVGPNCGVAGLQAIWSGLPTVAIQVDESYQAAGLEDIIPNSNNPGLLSSYIARLSGEQRLRDELITRQHLHVQENHSLETYCRDTEKFYRDLLNEKL